MMRSFEKTIGIVGAGMNGLMCAFILARQGYKVIVLERSDRVGGACYLDTTIFGDHTYSFMGGASVFGFMQKRLWKKTGLRKQLTFKPADAAYFFGSTPFKPQISSQFEQDLSKVTLFLRKGFLHARIPSVEEAEKTLGSQLTRLWITGSARELVDHYFTDERSKITLLLSVTESGAVSIDERHSAFTISLMHTGSVDSHGRWGYIEGGLALVPQMLAERLEKEGVTIIMSAGVQHVDNAGYIVYEKEEKRYELQVDKVVFATEPLTAARIVGDRELIDSFAGARTLGTAAKLTGFFSEDPRFGDGLRDALRYYLYQETVQDFEKATMSVTGPGGVPYTRGFHEYYAESRHDGFCRKPDWKPYGVLSIFFKHVRFEKPGTELPAVQAEVVSDMLSNLQNPETFIGSVLRTPKDLSTILGFAGGNIDHLEIAKPHTFFGRTFSSNPSQWFYMFGRNRNIFYCGAGSYPCGSVAGTNGYMCAMELLRIIHGS